MHFHYLTAASKKHMEAYHLSYSRPSTEMAELPPTHQKEFSSVIKEHKPGFHYKHSHGAESRVSKTHSSKAPRSSQAPLQLVRALKQSFYITHLYIIQSKQLQPSRSAHIYNFKPIVCHYHLAALTTNKVCFTTHHNV